MCDQVALPAIHLPFALEAQSIQLLRLNFVALQQLKYASKQVLCVSWVLIQFASQAIKNNVLLLCRNMQVADERLQFRLEWKHVSSGCSLPIFTLALRKRRKRFLLVYLKNKCFSCSKVFSFSILNCYDGGCLFGLLIQVVVTECGTVSPLMSFCARSFCLSRFKLGVKATAIHVVVVFFLRSLWDILVH